MHRRALAVLLAGLVILAIPAASAGHWMLYHAGIEEHAGWTMEPDEIVLHAPGHPLDGMVNRVHLTDEVLGDGGLFLDAMLGQHVGHRPIAAGFDTYLARDFFGHQVIFPGFIHISAWYGYWNDHEGDGYIHDVHDAACGGAACPEDEFRWRGTATNEALSLIMYRIPANTLAPAQDRHSLTSTPLSLDDQTHHANTEQGWKGAAHLYSNGDGFLQTLYTVVAAGAPPTAGSDIRVDMDRPGVLVDVDRYEAVNGDVEALFYSAFSAREALTSAAGEIRDGITGQAEALLDEISEEIGIDPEDEHDRLNEWRLETTRYAADLVLSGPQGIVAHALDLIARQENREPNHADDDFEHRAWFGGVGDYAGSYNVYPGYAEEWGFYFDNVHRASVCTRTKASAPGATVDPSWGVCSTELAMWEPQRLVSTPPGHVQGMMLRFEAYNLLWNDFNGDGYLGAVCDPAEPDEFDAETNTCRNLPRHRPVNNSEDETVGVCEQSSARGGHVLLTPPSGGWNGAILIRDVNEAVRPVPDLGITVLESDEVVSVRFNDACQSANVVGTRDGLLLPYGSLQGPIRVEAFASIEGFTDTNTGIDVGAQSVLDVDILHPWL